MITEEEASASSSASSSSSFSSVSSPSSASSFASSAAASPRPLLSLFPSHHHCPHDFIFKCWSCLGSVTVLHSDESLSRRHGVAELPSRIGPCPQESVLLCLPGAIFLGPLVDGVKVSEISSLVHSLALLLSSTLFLISDPIVFRSMLCPYCTELLALVTCWKNKKDPVSRRDSTAIAFSLSCSVCLVASFSHLPISVHVLCFFLSFFFYVPGSMP